MNKFKASVILMGIDWSKAAKFIAENDIKVEDPQLASLIDTLDESYRTERVWMN